MTVRKEIREWVEATKKISQWLFRHYKTLTEAEWLELWSMSGTMTAYTDVILRHDVIETNK